MNVFFVSGSRTTLHSSKVLSKPTHCSPLRLRKVSVKLAAYTSLLDV